MQVYGDRPAVTYGGCTLRYAQLDARSDALARDLCAWGVAPDDRVAVYLPRGVAHGFCVLSDEADYLYQVTEYFQGAETPSVAWNDPDVGIGWPVAEPVLSERDWSNPPVADVAEAPEYEAGA